jgi:anti-anti-sigma factor
MAVQSRASEINPDITVLSLSGRLDVMAVEAATPVARSALEHSAAGMVVDLRQVDFISSAGFRMLLTVYQEAERTGKALALAHPQPAVYKIFKVAGLGAKFSFFDDQSDAVQAIQPRGRS